MEVLWRRFHHISQDWVTGRGHQQGMLWGWFPGSHHSSLAPSPPQAMRLGSPVGFGLCHFFITTESDFTPPPFTQVQSSSLPSPTPSRGSTTTHPSQPQGPAVPLGGWGTMSPPSGSPSVSTNDAEPTLLFLPSAPVYTPAPALTLDTPPSPGAAGGGWAG